MPRTTLDLDPGVLAELKRRKEHEGRSLGAVASDLLARALAAPAPEPPEFSWVSKSLRPRVDLDDKEALHRLLDPP